jgi:hypothetical protein
MITAGNTKARLFTNLTIQIDERYTELSLELSSRSGGRQVKIDWH